MRRSWRRVRIPALVILLAIAAAWANNTSLFTRDNLPLKVLAHRGVTQTTSQDLGPQGCVARAIDPPRHEFVENTIASIREAFRLGADGVEIDVHPTVDGEFVVFHDWTLDCATNGSGVTRERDSTHIRSLDPAYFYTADNGRTYPLRGKWTGQIPLLSTVLDTFADEMFLINIKSNDGAEGDALARYLTTRGHATKRISVYGGDEPVARLRAAAPQVRGLSRQTAISDLLTYEAVGRTGDVPGSMAGNMVGVPLDRAGALWGWPGRFTERMAESDTLVLLVASAGQFAEGFDDPAQLRTIPGRASGYVVTNEIAAVIAELHRLGRR